MIVRSGTTLWRALSKDWFTLMFFSSLTVAAEFVYEYEPLMHTALPLLPSLPLSVLITAMSIFLGFQINQCYERWWAAIGRDRSAVAACSRQGCADVSRCGSWSAAQQRSP